MSTEGMRLLVSQLGLALMAVAMVAAMGKQWYRARTLTDIFGRRRATAVASINLVTLLVGITLLVVAGKL